MAVQHLPPRGLGRGQALTSGRASPPCTLASTPSSLGVQPASWLCIAPSTPSVCLSIRGG
ncbi:hypothetical protein M427DRAFT_58038 [Gonapodya prolifera JEL478]|uniref:Uncharacterized protein n=1 Tax=Gonapodya prolifera (strain JEL478) TaxID=1344416 RepID=A0A139ABK0_GONPJ|nr:hypothetical protein M427DRAFT_58038 [Gonapodya prolifera JEL478]|eukprot:KXS14049.1 hypothetical protein M427DRAFT_58038 [Gonapodya prolifera JEL478]